ncbi:LysE family translocator [Budvicia aquatica]|uniref:LysE family translocator n=1 Tax=Budvicia aquatica TaxID=82979 RepID=A0A2C6DLA5_9GAMM|nr:LysE family translocator [Budvicia aquatica]PHI29601.1 LysE family translocator [Budvicia aquatica]GKX50155.1 lysine transporter LysE [Budvicia aquatica]
MIDLTTLSTYLVVVLGLFLIPGPAVLLVLTRTAQGGRKTGIMTGLGIALGDSIHALLAAVGLSAILMTSALAFNIVKIVGAGYLIYLGVRALLEKRGDSSAPIVQNLSPMKAFLQAVPAEILNPKTALFFLAFFPQFVHPEQGSSLMQFTILGAIFVVLGILYTTTLVFIVRPLGILLKRLSWLNRWQGKIIGTIFISLGLKVALQSQ